MKRLLITALMLLASAGSAGAQDHQHHMAMPPACAEVSLACADKATPFFGPDGALWLAWSANGRVAVVRSRDLGQHFSKPAFVNAAAEKLDAGADSRPQIVIDRDGKAVVAYTVARDANYNGQVLTARSDAAVRMFAAPKPIMPEGVSQRFVSFALDSHGDVFAAWIEKHNLAAATSQKPATRAALAFAWAKPGENFAATRIAQDDTCECCRIGVAFAGPGQPVVIWRNIFAGGVRDHAVMSFADGKPGPVYRVAVDNWKIDVCPHQGPSLTVATNGTYHAAWFTEGSVRQGVFYARSRDGGRTFSTPVAVGESERQPSRPYVYAVAGEVWMVWKEFDGTRSTVNVMASHDDGMTWSKPKVVAATDEASDHPLLGAWGNRVFLSWLTRKDGYRLIPLEQTP